MASLGPSGVSPAIIRPSSASSAPRAHMIWLTLMSSCHPRAPRPHSRATNKHTHINTHTRRTNAQTQSATAPTPLPLAASRLCCRTGRTPGELRSILTVTPPCVSASLRAAGVRRWLCVCVGGGGCLAGVVEDPLVADAALEVVHRLLAQLPQLARGGGEGVGYSKRHSLSRPCAATAV